MQKRNDRRKIFLMMGLFTNLDRDLTRNLGHFSFFYKTHTIMFVDLTHVSKFFSTLHLVKKLRV